MHWKQYKFSEFVDINPKVSLSSSKSYSFVEMKDLEPSNKFCTPSIKKILTGGARFINQDTLFARITPCLENGKICQVRGLDDNKGFGSTEFLVFRGKELTSNNDFVYYLSRWSEVREFAEINLHGTSGRQRVPKEAFNELLLELPSIKEQESIAEVLSSLDDKIDLLHRNNKTLEQLAETLFRHWFVEDIDQDGVSTIYEYVTIDYGYPFNSKLFNENHEGIPLIRIRDLKAGSMNTFTTEYVDEKYLVKRGDLLVGMDGEFRINIWRGNKAWLNQRVCRINPKESIPDYFAYFMLKPYLNFYELTKGGTTVIHLGKSDFDEIKIPTYSTDLIQKYGLITQPIFEKFKNNSKSILSLQSLRDTLLPKLMSGSVIVNNTHKLK